MSGGGEREPNEFQSTPSYDYGSAKRESNTNRCSRGRRPRPIIRALDCPLANAFGVERLLGFIGVERVKRRGRHAPLRRSAFSVSEFHLI